MTQIAHAGFPASTGMFLGLAGFVATIMTVSVYGVCFCSYALSRVLVGWNLVWEIDFSDFHNRAVPDLEDAGGHRADRRPRGNSGAVTAINTPTATSVHAAKSHSRSTSGGASVIAMAI